MTYKGIRGSGDWSPDNPHRNYADKFKEAGHTTPTTPIVLPEKRKTIKEILEPKLPWWAVLLNKLGINTRQAQDLR